MEGLKEAGPRDAEAGRRFLVERLSGVLDMAPLGAGARGVDACEPVASYESEMERKVPGIGEIRRRIRSIVYPDSEEAVLSGREIIGVIRGILDD